MLSKKQRAAKKALTNNALAQSNRDLQSMFAGRGNFIGEQLETSRDLICQYGYPKNPVFSNFYSLYRRIGLAKAGCDMPVDSVWSDWPTIRDVTEFDSDGEPEYNDEVKTEFEIELNKLIKDQKLAFKDRVRSLDRKQRIGQYAGSLIVARDVNSAKMNEPLESLVPGNLVKLVPLFESQLIESEWDTDLTSANYGEPTMYQVAEFATGSKSNGQNRSFNCHPSRLIMAAEGAEDGTIYGTPAMMGCFYALMDWEKIRMSSAEGSKKNADQRSVLSLKEGSNLPTGATAELMDENINEFDRGDLSTLVISDASMSSLNSSMGDPTKPAELCEKEIAANYRIPMTVLVGFQTGKLASDKDTLQWNSFTMERREGFGNHLLMQHINRFIEIGVLPMPNGEVVIDWPDAREASQSDKLAMGEQAANIRYKIYQSGGVPESVIPDSYFHETLDIDVVDAEGIDDEPDNGPELND
jgi:hypothetical protein